jgi:2-methylaconitate cis-trans-isomerase PrpF
MQKNKIKSCSKHLAHLTFRQIDGLGWADPLPMTKVRICNTNTKKVILAEFWVENGEFISEGDFRMMALPAANLPSR